MKKQATKRIAISALILVLITVLLLSYSGIGHFTSYAADYIQQFDGTIKTNYQDYFDSSVVTTLPQTIKEDDQISVIVNLDDPALIDLYLASDTTMSFGEYAYTDEANEVRNTVLSKKAAILAALGEEEVAYKTGSDYAAVLSGFEVVIEARDFDTLCDVLGDEATAILGEVYNPCETQLVENEVNFDEDTGIFNSSDFAYDGSGMLVAVLDTGLDYTHSAFSLENFTAETFALTKEEVAAYLSDTRAASMVDGLSADDVYINQKVPFAFDYADEDSDVYSLHNNHGTHVSGVIVGNDDTITGVAPNAQLVSMKIFSDVRDSAYTSWILAALEDCVVLGVDVINMSLGTACGFSREMDKEAVTGVYDKIREMGISLVVAASNSFSSAYASEKNGNLGLTSNPDTATVGSPSTYEGALSVASINGVKTPYILYNNRIVYFTESTNSATDEKKFVEEILPADVNEQEFEFVLVPGSGREADYSGMDVTGKIVLVERGFNTFEEKANAAQKNGAAGIIIFNNVSGEIKMNVGTTTIPVCSISQDDGEVLAAAKSGKIKISRSQTSGPFMSDFSSWGPTPDLGIKPEITAHGGNILSSVTGGGYDRLSGTSMACPNMAGVVTLLRQYVMDAFPDIADNAVEVNAVVNRLLMSTADIVINTNGLPYAVRKQGAGLANLTSASTTSAYILTYDREDGSVMDKTKIELGDDPDKTGVYTLKFSIDNFGSSALTYELSAYVMTEGVSTTKTHNGETTVDEAGYLLEGATVSYSVTGAEQDQNRITVSGQTTADVTVTITLSDADKKYLDDSFENGMYVEGFVTLTATAGTEVDLSVPYLAFYGDWTEAPLFDLDYFETNADELDDSIETLDKTLPDAYATRPIGGVSEDYVSYLGSYYFLQDPAASKVISADRNYIALSNTEGTVHSLRFVWAGLLRNAERVEVTITDDTTGEVIFEIVDDDVRKSYGDGGSIYPANIEIEFDTADYNLKNNTEYTVRLVGYLDYKDGGIETNEKNVFEFPLVADFEAPAITGCEFYTEYDKDLKKNRLFARVAVYDNHYTMSIMPGYVTMLQNDESYSYEMKAFDSYMTPVFSERDSTTYVDIELTDYIDQIKNNRNPYRPANVFTVACYDYALNEATYEIALPDEFVDFYFEETEITLSPNELYDLSPVVYPNTEWAELLEFTSSDSEVARVVNNRLLAVTPGVARIRAVQRNDDGDTVRVVDFRVKVLSEEEEGYQYYDKPVADVFKIVGYDTLKAYYILDSSERELGETGDYNILGPTASFSLSFYPSESIQLDYTLDAYFPEQTEVVFESSNEKIVTVDQNGIIVAQEEGFASVTVNVLQEGKSTYYSQSIDIEVKNPYVTTAPSLTHYFGLGGIVEIPSSLLLTQIGNYAFSNYNYVPKTENDIISEDEPDATKMMYIGDNTITKVIIPEGVKSIGSYAFANLTALTEVVLPSTLETIEYGAFYGCTSLKKVTGIENVKLINRDAFADCNITGTLTFQKACAIGDYAFANNRNIKELVFPASLQSIGAYAFYGNTGLNKVTVAADKVKYGAYVFSECTSLTEIEMNANVIPTGAFYGCDALAAITIGKDVSSIGEFAFGGTAISSFRVAEGNTTYQAQEDKTYLLSADGKSLLLAAPRVSGEFRLNEASVTTVGRGAFSSAGRLTSVVLENVTALEDYAFAYCSRLESVTLGKLTKIGAYAFFETGIETAPDFEGVAEIGDYAFAYTDLKELTIPDGMKIGEGAFCECRSLATVTIGDNVTIGDSAFLLNRYDNSELVSDTSFGKKEYYSFEYLSPLTSLTIGDNVIIQDNAFLGAAKLVRVTLGENAVIGKQAFYNACSLTDIDLSKVLSIGEGAFSGDQLYVYADPNQSSYAYDEELNYIYKYYAPALVKVDISSATELGEKAFLYGKALEEVLLGDAITEIPAMAFYECDNLKTINLDKIKTVRSNAFVKTALESVELPSAALIEMYAFVYCDKLETLVLSDNGTDIQEGAFAYCEALQTVENLEAVKHIGSYAFAYAALTSANLSSLESLGDHAFMKEETTPFDVTLGTALVEVGDNPFAFCQLKPFSSVTVESFNGKEYEQIVYTYAISDSVRVIDGSLYADVPNGMELITYAGTDDAAVVLADRTVRITAMAFAGSDVVRVTFPYTLSSIGHKAFYGCDKLTLVVFTSYEAPNLEEEFDSTYYDCFDNLPANGDYEFTLLGDTVVKQGLAIVPYYMWNLTDGKYCNVYYGANFVDYIGHNDSYVVMVKPANGLYYDTFIYNQYFKTVVEGDVAADATTLLAIEAIRLLPESVKLTDKALVVAAREAYDKIATKEQQALVYNLTTLLSAEERIKALEDNAASSSGDPNEPSVDQKVDTEKVLWIVVIAESIVLLAVLAALILLLVKMSNKKKALGLSEKTQQTEQASSTEAEQATEDSNPETKE